MSCRITPVPTGYFTLPGHEISKYPGVRIRSRFVVCAYLVESPRGVGLFDTGLASDTEATARFTPRSFDLTTQLAELGFALTDISWIANCHMHADHAGGNYLFPETPVYVQADELTAARGRTTRCRGPVSTTPARIWLSSTATASSGPD